MLSIIYPYRHRNLLTCLFSLFNYRVQYSLSTSREERKHLYLVLFDYVLHQINETCVSTGVSEYSDDEVQPVATLLALADAPEAFYISVKLGVEGIGELLRRSISAALSRYPNSERLNMVMFVNIFAILPVLAKACMFLMFGWCVVGMINQKWAVDLVCHVCGCLYDSTSLIHFICASIVSFFFSYGN